MTDTSTWGIKFDPADPDYSPFAAAAVRVAKLLDVAPDDHDLTATLDILLGALYALALAKHEDYEHRTGRAERDEIVKRAHDVAGGRTRMDSKWIAGFHFNSGILRIAAVYHRALKIVSDQREERGPSAPTLSEKVREEADYSTWTDDSLDIVHDDVNAVKHNTGGVVETRKATPDHAEKAIDEILKLLELWADLQA